MLRSLAVSVGALPSGPPLTTDLLRMPRQTVIIILGMHRSGTSSLAGSLQSAGVALGEVNTQAPHNAKGNRESRRIMDLNDRVLANSGHAWNCPPLASGHWAADNQRERDAIIAELSCASRWGFKDPRTLFTLEGWLERLPQAHLIGTFRHPARVADSLASRPAPLYVSPTQGLQLWLAYNRRLLRLWQQHRFPLINFDQDAEDYQRQMSALCRQFGLPNPPDFFDHGLRRARIRETAVDAQVCALHEQLLEASTAVDSSSNEVAVAH